MKEVSTNKTSTVFAFFSLGKTSWEKDDRIRGKLNIPLDDKTIEFFSEVLNGCDNYKPKNIITSDCSPELNAADIIKNKFGGKIKKYSIFNELNLGLWEGSLESEIMRMNGKYFRQWQDDPTSISPPNGENIKDKFKAVTKLFDDISIKYKGHELAFITPPIITGMIKCHLNNAPLSKLWDYVSNEANIFMMEAK